MVKVERKNKVEATTLMQRMDSITSYFSWNNVWWKPPGVSRDGPWTLATQ